MLDKWKRRRDERLIGKDIAKLDQAVADLEQTAMALQGAKDIIRHATEETEE